MTDKYANASLKKISGLVTAYSVVTSGKWEREKKGNNEIEKGEKRVRKK